MAVVSYSPRSKIKKGNWVVYKFKTFYTCIRLSQCHLIIYRINVIFQDLRKSTPFKFRFVCEAV